MPTLPWTIRKYLPPGDAFLDKVRGRDDVSFALVVGLLGAETHRTADVTAALAGQ